MKIEVLFPEICNLYGELANMRYLRESAPELEFVETSIKEKPAFIDEDIALVYLGTMTESAQIKVINALRPYIEKIKARIDEGKAFLITGNAMEVFGKEIIEDDKKVIDGLGIFDFVAKRSSLHRVNSLYVGDFVPSEGEDAIKVVGFKSLFGYSFGDGLKEKLFDTVLGYGTNEEIKEEGIRCNNFMATYLTGPLLILNPLMAKWIMEEFLGIEDAKPVHFEAAMDAYNYRLKEYLSPGKGWIYH